MLFDPSRKSVSDEGNCKILLSADRVGIIEENVDLKYFSNRASFMGRTLSFLNDMKLGSRHCKG